MDRPSSLEQGLTLMSAVVDRERSGRLGYNASRLAQLTDMERSRVSRLTQELRSLDYLDRTAESVFSTGPAFFRTAGTLDQPWLRAARRELRLLASKFRMTARITVPDGPRALLLRFESGIGAPDASLRAGMRTPVWSTGAGRALLVDHDLAELQSLLEGVQFVGVGGPAAARSVPELWELLERDRAQGVTRAVNEYVAGITEFALPIRSGEAILASASVEGPPVAAATAAAVRTALEGCVHRLGSV